MPRAALSAACARKDLAGSLNALDATGLGSNGARRGWGGQAGWGEAV